MLSDQMKRLITDFTAGMVATVNADGTPAVSPKATFVVLDDTTLAYGDIRSPGTAANLRRHPAVEVCFLDVLSRRAVRVSGTARILPKAEAGPEVLGAFETVWAEYLPHMSAFVIIDVTAAELILSPAYDVGYSAADLCRANLAKLNAL